VAVAAAQELLVVAQRQAQLMVVMEVPVFLLQSQVLL
jgi:hypothetical protein